jgi:hypothetical protein
MDPPSIKDKRLRKEVPLLPYETIWMDGSNELLVPKYCMKISVTPWYPFRYPSMTIDNIPEAEYILQLQKNVDEKRITEVWCPSYGIREFVDNFLRLYPNNLNVIQLTEPPDFSNSETSTSTTGL